MAIFNSKLFVYQRVFISFFDNYAFWRPEKLPLPQVPQALLGLPVQDQDHGRFECNTVYSNPQYIYIYTYFTISCYMYII